MRACAGKVLARFVGQVRDHNQAKEQHHVRLMLAVPA